MKLALSLFAALTLLGAAPATQAQDLRAVTEDGRKVLLSRDGKWRFELAGTAAAAPVSSWPLQTRIKKVTVAYDTAEWVLRKDEEDPSKRMFRHKTLPLYGAVIAEEIPVPSAALREVILGNARSVGAKTTVLVDESRTISGKPIGYIRFLAAMNGGLEFIYSTNYFGDEDGNFQITCFTAQALFHKHQADCQRFIDSISIK